MKELLSLVSVVLAFLGACDVQASDWPQYRCDASRSASSPEQLPATLNLAWVRRLPAPRPAFPGEVRLWFDASYEPVVCGHTMFVPSMVTDSVTALDTETGAQRWQFFAEGPVRFAPLAWEGNVYFVSDDGHLYCVDAAEGKLRWRFFGMPAGKRDRKLLGSGRLVSLFPARGGPVLRNGVVYFGAGIWSGSGVAIHALDARSGKVVWSNTDSDHIPRANMDHGIAHAAGLTPQGYLAVVHEILVVPCGAQLPAFLDLKTGALREYSMGWGGRNGLPKGTWFVAGTKNYLSHGGDLYDIARVNDERFDDPRMRTDFKGLLYPGGFTRVRIDATNHKDLGAFQEPVFDGDVMYDGSEGVTAYDLGAVKLEERKNSPIPAIRRSDTYPDKWRMSCRELWKMPSKLRVHIKAGQHIYLGGPGVVQALRTGQPGGEPQVAWQATVEGTPHRMLAADGRLFVVTREGVLYAFGGNKGPAPSTYAPPAAPAPAADAWTKTAADILQTTNVRDGYALVLGVGTGRLTEELLRQSNLDVIAIDRDAAKVEQLRQRLHSAGLYGTRASAHVGDPLSYPLPPYMASLVVSEDSAALVAPAGVKPVEAVFHPLRPYGGTACLALPPAQRDRLIEAVTGRSRLPGDSASSHLCGARAQRVREWTVLARTGPLPGAADWSHESADAANTGASEEQFVKAPLELLWFDGPPRWTRTPGATLVRVCGGRMFIKAEKLVAIDVFTGRRFWEAPLPFRHSVDDQMVAADDALYVAGGRTCVVLDQATGRKTAEIDLPADVTGTWANMRIWQDQLLAQSGRHLLCVDRRSGRLAWKYQCGRAGLSVAVGGGKAFCAELANKRWLETGDKDTKTRALDIATGTVLWEIAGGSEVRYSRPLDLVVLSSGIYRAKDGSLLAALPQPAPKPGSKASPESLPKPLFLIGTRMLFGNAESYVEYDLRTGRTSGEPMTWTRRGCTIPRASSNLVTTRFRGNAACIDLASREVILFWNVRTACSNNLFPADGVLNMPSLTGGCTCNYLPVSQGYVPLAVIRRGGGPEDCMTVESVPLDTPSGR
jgi:outer membrane protein assembly factor BamB